MQRHKPTELSKKEFDLLVVGGGINGAAIANMAAASGARVLLVEKGDWASGTSSKSTKLLHGGIRYLENFEFDLVKESLRERYVQWKSVPYLVKPLRFVIPIYQGQGRPLWMMKLGVWLYDRLSGRYMFGSHTYLSKDKLLAMAPDIKGEGLQAGVCYFDAQMDDARLCLENVLMAKKQGAVTANYVELVDFIKINGRAVGARLRDLRSNESFDVKAAKLIVAGGPWADILRHKDAVKLPNRLRPTKGVHIVYRGQMGNDAFLLQNNKDGRIFFMIPFKGNTLIGTTDTDNKQSPDELKVEDEDIDYLLAQARAAFPFKNFSKSGIITTFAGLRPLVNEEGSTSKISRQHTIEKSLSGVHYVMGGKYTTYRAIAFDCLRRVLPKNMKSVSLKSDYPLYGSDPINADTKVVATRFGVSHETILYLISLYGARYVDVLELIHQDASLKSTLCSCSLAIRAQVVYALKVEMAFTLDDIYDRRLGICYNDCSSRQCRQTISQMLQ